MIRICGRQIDEKAACSNLGVWYCMGQDITHIEVGFRRVCPGSTCSYAELKGNHVSGEVHWVFYTALRSRSDPNSAGVKRAIKTSHGKDPGLWYCFQMECPLEQEMEGFLKDQLQAKYDEWTFNWFLFRKCFTCESLFVEDESEYKPRVPATRKEWICSELIANALVAGGVFSPKEFDTSRMTAEDIIIGLKQKYAHTNKLYYIAMTEEERFT